jgi:flavin reductase (DIM6/NTAB) family NADH-FMN oxidoreductase RutF
VDGPFLKDAYFYLECELHRIVDGFGLNSLIVGSVVGACAHRDALRLSEEDDEELLRRRPLLAYVDPGRYAEINTTHAFPLPEGFKK